MNRHFLGTATLVVGCALVSLVPACGAAAPEEVASSSHRQQATGEAPVAKMKSLPLKPGSALFNAAQARARAAGTSEALTTNDIGVMAWELSKFEGFTSYAEMLAAPVGAVAPYFLEAAAGLTLGTVAFVGVAVVVVAGVTVYYAVALQPENENAWWARPAWKTRELVLDAIANATSWSAKFNPQGWIGTFGETQVTGTEEALDRDNDGLPDVLLPRPMPFPRLPEKLIVNFAQRTQGVVVHDVRVGSKTIKANCVQADWDTHAGKVADACHNHPQFGDLWDLLCRDSDIVPNDPGRTGAKYKAKYDALKACKDARSDFARACGNANHQAAPIQRAAEAMARCATRYFRTTGQQIPAAAPAPPPCILEYEDRDGQTKNVNAERGFTVNVWDKTKGRVERFLCNGAYDGAQTRRPQDIPDSTYATDLTTTPVWIRLGQVDPPPQPAPEPCTSNCLYLPLVVR